MEDLLRLAAGYLRGMWRYRWWGLAMAWLVGMAGGVIVYQMPDRFTSSARVFVDTQSVLRPLMSGLAVQPNVSQQVAILSRTLITRPNVEKLITMADLDLEVRTPEEREALMNRLMGGLRISSGPRGETNLFYLRYEDRVPERAQRVVQALLSLFVESGLVGKRQDTATARRFIDEQIRAYELRLTEAENRMTEFRIRHMGLLGPGASSFVSQVGEMTARLEQARLELREAESLRDNLARQLQSEHSEVPRRASDPLFLQHSEFDSRIEGLKQQLDGFLLRYTDQHPDVISTRRIIEELEKQKMEEIELRSQAGSDDYGFDANPIYQQMKLALGQADAQVITLRTRVEEFEKRLEDLRASAQLRPQLEAELTQLDRDYNIHKRNYEQLVQRRETATMSADMEAQSGITQFRVIDPPTLPLNPSAPNRILLVGVAAALALGAGIALAFLLSQLRPVVTDARALRDFTGLPVLGSVSLLADAGRIRRERLGLLAFGSGLAGFAGLMSATAVAIQYLQG